MGWQAREAAGVTEFLESLGHTGCAFVAFSQLVSKVVSYLFMNRDRVALGRGIYTRPGEKDFRRVPSLWKSITNCNVEFRGISLAEFHAI